MPGHYEFDRSNFSFRKVTRTAGSVLLTVLKYFLVTASLAVVYYIIFAAFVSTDTERRLRRENKIYEKVYPEMLDEYLKFAGEVGRTSVETEPGVLKLLSMQHKTDPCRITILEVYADDAAYQSHLQTLHFKKYKEGTAKMVKSLKLIDVDPIYGL